MSLLDVALPLRTARCECGARLDANGKCTPASRRIQPVCDQCDGAGDIGGPLPCGHCVNGYAFVPVPAPVVSRSVLGVCRS